MDPRLQGDYLRNYPAGHTEEHPFIVLILILGGILNPWFHLVEFVLNIINRKLETRAGKNSLWTV
jgi:uncharacterized protein YybS (DUF2232 family)